MPSVDCVMTVFIREAPIEENTASEWIRTEAATCSCKIVQLCEYEAMRAGTNRTANDTEKRHQFMQHKGQKDKIVGLRSFCIL